MLNEFNPPDGAVEINSKLLFVCNKKTNLKQVKIVDITKEFTNNLLISELATSEGADIPSSWQLINKDGNFYLKTEDETPKKLFHKQLKQLDFKCEFKQDNEKMDPTRLYKQQSGSCV
ncbi:hypothetical protein [Psychromonas sp. KJ10-2]|uniref:hypothetical protein n=1 Tax=Psychromonas sp. KJ10-2 TaxID=3391822 RepID=UPI0039B4AB6D